jgi:hypothetical protein
VTTKDTILAISLVVGVATSALAEPLPDADQRRPGAHPAHRHLPDRVRRQGQLLRGAPQRHPARCFPLPEHVRAGELSLRLGLDEIDAAGGAY